MNSVQHVFIIGSKGIPARYGGYETFVENLTKRRVNDSIKYHVSCIGEKKGEFEYNSADCFNVTIPDIGPAKAILYDLKSFVWCIKYIKRNKIKKPIVYVLTCRIGPFYRVLVHKIHKLGGLVYLNPDGHEWLRAKWSKPVRLYWKKSEKLMVKYSDLIICDSKNIETYIRKNYRRFAPRTIFIAYGSDITPSALSNQDAKFSAWLKSNDIISGEYYLSVGRFVPENNFETMIREFMMSKTKRTFVIISTYDEKFFMYLKNKLGFDKDERIKFVGSVYDSELLKKIREQAFCYFHGHSVGGTNPSLLEALSATDLNLLYDVGFNREVAEDTALYWSNETGNLAKLIDFVDLFDEKKRSLLGESARKRIYDEYNWQLIVEKYENVFRGN